MTYINHVLAWLASPPLPFPTGEEQRDLLFDFFLALAVCHTVIPERGLSSSAERRSRRNRAASGRRSRRDRGRRLGGDRDRSASRSRSGRRGGAGAGDRSCSGVDSSFFDSNGGGGGCSGVDSSFFDSNHGGGGGGGGGGGCSGVDSTFFDSNGGGEGGRGVVFDEEKTGEVDGLENRHRPPERQRLQERDQDQQSRQGRCSSGARTEDSAYDGGGVEGAAEVVREGCVEDDDDEEEEEEELEEEEDEALVEAEDGKEEGPPKLSASSPDDEALVSFAWVWFIDTRKRKRDEKHARK